MENAQEEQLNPENIPSTIYRGNQEREGKLNAVTTESVIPSFSKHLVSTYSVQAHCTRSAYTVENKLDVVFVPKGINQVVTETKMSK